MIDARKWSRLVGAAGVADTENVVARRVSALFEMPMLIAALGLLLKWWADTSGVDMLERTDYFNIALWSLFVVETALLSLLTSNTTRYLRENWLNLVIILLGAPLFVGWSMEVGALRLLRLLIAFSLMIHLGNRIGRMLSPTELSSTLLASAIVIIMAGVMMAALEPQIRTPMDGIWWAWVTVTTVGYGDIVPVTVQGRIFGILVILIGLCLFTLITASFAAYFVGKQQEKKRFEEEDNYRRMCDMDERLYRLEQKLDRILEELHRR